MNSKHLLVADDEKHIRLALSLILRRTGYRVTMVEDGQELLLKVLELKDGARPDLLIIDIQMPGWTGLELIEKLAKRGLAIPILLISGYKYREMVAGFKTSEAITYLEKPFSPEELLLQVEYLLQWSPPRDQPILKGMV